MGGGGDDVDGEADQKGADGRVDWPKERENNSQKPYGNNHRQPHKSPQTQAFCVVHSNHFLPHKVQRRTRKPKRYELHVQSFRS